ncbi:MAG: endo alpha-1,4 polygalactosaminidase [Sulfurihydrogenibium sp.]|jgi:uncharacterized protein (TIGR01370 family)|nr:endo alpha-1,4 polygalactosaminidase [Sulfurihydrogenibium sp.]
MRYIIRLLCLFNLLFIFNLSYGKDLSIGFIYREPPEEAFYLYDWLVVDPDNFSFEKLKEKYYIKNKKAKLFAYVSVGEIEPYRKYYKEIDKSWIIGENKDWKTYIADIRKKEYREFLINKVLKNLSQYDGFFFDTLDSYQIALKPSEYKDYENALAEFIIQVKKTFPDKKIILNRGFEVVPQVKDYIDAVVAESLFYGLDTKTMKYKKMKEEDTRWLLNKLNEIKNLGVKVIVIDYVDPKNKKLQKEVAKKIYENGFIPYVTDKDLKTLGTSIYQIIPRKIMILYNSKEFDAVYNDLHRNFQAFVEYLGYVPVMYDINKELPKDYIGDEYAGILLRQTEYSPEMLQWLKKQISDGIKVFFLSYIPSDEEFLSFLGLKIEGYTSIFDKVDFEPISYNYFEIKPEIQPIPITIPQNNFKPILKAKINDKEFYPFAITDWGGYALEGTFLSESGKNALLVFNPVEIFRDVFKPDFPAPDVTTENGNRILTAHIDGDAFFGVADFDPQKNLGEIIRDEILKKYKIPHTVSIVEGEIAPWGLYPDKSKKLEEIARSIFALENVEIASHSFSHPFKWRKLYELEKQNKESKEKGYSLPIKNYEFNLEREIIGSIDYINKNLAPENKKTKVFLWTGDCVPPKEALQLTYKIGVYNVNGGDTWINYQEPFYTLIGPMGLNRDEYFQVYAPIQNENVYTNLWRDYYGYIKSISTFKLTDEKYRFKPISIYYHFYSGQKIASLKALKEVYDYALSQEINPMFLSEYAQRVLEFRNTVVAKDLEDNFVIRNEGNLKTVRFDKDVKIDIFKSQNVVGFRKIHDSIYVHLTNNGDSKIFFSSDDPNFMVINSNGQIKFYEKDGKVIKIKLEGYIPLTFKILNKNCKLNITPNGYILKKDRNYYDLKFTKGKEVYMEAHCGS